MSNFSIVPDNMKTPIIQLGESSKKPGRPTADQLETIIKVCTNAEDYQSQYSQRLLDYFRDPESDASYLMADFVSAKAAEQLLDENGQYTIPYKYGDFDGAGKKALRHFEDLKMYDKKNRNNYNRYL